MSVAEIKKVLKHSASGETPSTLKDLQEADHAPSRPAAITSISRADIPLAVLNVIPIDQLQATGGNPRRNWDKAALEELAASIREHGIQSPLLVRPNLETVGGKQVYQIIAGHRRCVAGTMAGLKALPCIVRDLSDDEAAEIAIIDNLQRVDIPPMDEAVAFSELLDRLLSIQAVAAKVGKEIAYVAKSLKLRSLTEPSRMALAEKLITIDHARLLCRLAELEQNEALKWCLDRNAGVKASVEDVVAERVAKRKTREDDDDDDPEDAAGRTSHNWTWEAQTVQRLKEHIESESGTPLDRAPWPMDEDWLIPDAGACMDCEKNTKANAPLFGDLDTGVAVCTDGGCFKAKTQGFVQIELKKASAENAPALSLSWKYTSTPPRLDKETGLPTLKQVFKYGQWIDVGAKSTKCEHTRPGVTVDWDGGSLREKLRKPGEVIQVCIHPKCKVHKKGYEKQSSGSGANGGREDYKEREAREKKELEAFVPRELPVRRALYDAIAAKLTGDALKSFLLRDANAASICAAMGFESENWEKRTKHAQGLIEKARGAELDRLLVASEIGSQLGVDHYDIDAADKGRGSLRKIAKGLGLDPAVIERTAEKAIAPPPPLKNKVAEKAMVETVAKMAKAAKPKPAAKKAAKKPSPKPLKKAGRK